MSRLNRKKLTKRIVKSRLKKKQKKDLKSFMVLGEKRRYVKIK